MPDRLRRDRHHLRRGHPLAAVAAKHLHEASGIPAPTAAWLQYIESGPGLTGIGALALALVLVLVLDEASMADDRAAARLIAEAARTGGLDHRRHPPGTAVPACRAVRSARARRRAAVWEASSWPQRSVRVCPIGAGASSGTTPDSGSARRDRARIAAVCRSTASVMAGSTRDGGAFWCAASA
ncbi:AAA family ATPase [Streptomyces tsukubensis]|uniref:AAA family ATPase n=1 Tax=Streptomyces tsukubensis TaxID=83656 RepID=UPI0036B42CCC